MKNVKEATFILDIFLTSDERELILTDNGMQEVREVAVDVYSQAARLALERGDLPAARDGFRSALLMQNKLLNPMSGDAAGSTLDGADALEQIDICIFYDNDSPVTGIAAQLGEMSCCLAEIFKNVFGLRYLLFVAYLGIPVAPLIAHPFVRVFLRNLTFCFRRHLCLEGIHFVCVCREGGGGGGGGGGMGLGTHARSGRYPRGNLALKQTRPTYISRPIDSERLWNFHVVLQRQSVIHCRTF